MTTLCRIEATASGNSGRLCEIDARTRRQYEYGAYEEGAYAEPHFLARVTLDTDATALEALFARQTRVQNVGFRCWRGGTLDYFNGVITGGVRVDHQVAGWSINRSLENTIQTASMTLNLDGNGESPLGSPLALAAPVPGLDAMHFMLAYKLPEDAANRYRGYPMMLYALADSSPRGGSGAISDQLTFRSNMARYAETPMTIRIPAGHGFTYGTAIQAICSFFPHGYLEARSLPQYVYPGTYFGIPHNFKAFPLDDRPLRKQIELAEGDWLSLAQAIGEVYGARIFDREDGVLDVAFIRPELGGPTGTVNRTRQGDIDNFMRLEGVISERDIVIAVNGSRIAEPSISPASSGPTHIRLTGSQQVTRDGAASAHSVITLDFDSDENVALLVAPFLQNSIGGLVDSGYTSSPELRRVTQGTTTIERDGQTVISSRTVSHGLVNPTAARFVLDENLEIDNYVTGVWVEENSLSSQAHLWPTQRLVPASETSFSRTFNADGYLVGTVKESSTYKHRRAYLQARASRTTSWEETSGGDLIAAGAMGRYSLGTGEGVATFASELVRTERETVTQSVVDKLVRSRTTVKEGFVLRPGWQYKYGDGFESRDAEEFFGVLERIEETWTPVPNTDNLTAYHMRAYDGDGQQIRGANDVLESEPPRADQLDDSAPKREDYQNDSDFALAVAASHFEQREMSIPVNGDDLLSVRPYKPQPYSSQWAQYPWQLERIGQRLIAMNNARTVTWTMLPNPLIVEGAWWHVRYRKPTHRIDHDVQITGKVISQSGPGAPILMQVTGLTWD